MPNQYALSTHMQLKKREEKEMLQWQQNAKRYEKHEFDQIVRNVKLNVGKWANQDNFKRMRRAIEE